MHFLCLHGSGTNGQIMELQIAALRYRLGPHHTYDFVDGEYDHPMEPGVAHLVNPGDSFYAYFDWNEPSSMLTVLAELDHLVMEANPPYDGIIGFSVGACLAATWLLRDALSTQCSSQQLRVAIFLAPAMGLSYAALLRGCFELQECLSGGPRLQIPTVLAYDEKDTVTPGHGSLLRGLCASSTNRTVVHHLGHTIPGVGNSSELERLVEAIKKAIGIAENGAGLGYRL